MEASEFERFLEDSLDPNTTTGQRMLGGGTPLPDATRSAAEKLGCLLVYRGHARPVAVVDPMMLPPCF